VRRDLSAILTLFPEICDRTQPADRDYPEPSVQRCPPDLGGTDDHRRMDHPPLIESFKKEGRQEGLPEGLREGLVKAKAADVLKIIDARGIEVTKEQRKEVADCTDLARLDRWFERALTAKTATDIFQY
jgi:hypothetical protein